MAVGGWGKDEGRQWQRAFRGPAPFALLAAALLLLTLAWQVPFGYTLDSANELKLDQPFMRNFNEVENTGPGAKGEWFRWSKGEGSLDFQGVGKRDYRLQMNLAASINPGLDYVVRANSTEIARGQLDPAQKTYVFQIPAQAISNRDGNLRVYVQVQAFIPAGKDPRELGFVFFSAKLDPGGGGPVVPPPTQLGWLLGAIMLAYALLARAGFRNWRAAGGAFGLALVLAYVVATPGARVWLTIFSSRVTLAFGWAVLMVVLADIPARRVWQFGWERRWALSIFGLVLAVRLAGILHPQGLTPSQLGPAVVDINFHVNRMFELWDRGRWWQKITSTEWGNRQTYYPATGYLLIGLFQWLIPDRKLLLLVWMVTLESSRVLLVFYLVKRLSGDGRSALLAGFLMAALPINMLSLAWGQVSNLFGEWVILVTLCLVVVKWDELRRLPYFALLSASLLLAFIMHPGVVLLAGIGFGLAGLLLWRSRGSRRGAWLFFAAYFLAIGLGIAVYHYVTIQEMVPQAIATLESKLRGGSVSDEVKDTGFRVGGQVRDARMGLVISYVKTVPELIVEGAKGFGREARVYYNVFPLLMMPWGLWWLWRTSGRSGSKLALAEADPLLETRRAARRRMFWVAVAWLGTVALFALASLVLNLYVRFWLFLLPIVAVGAGLFLGRLWRRLETAQAGWAGTLFVLALCAWLGLGTLTLYFDRIFYYLRGAG